ncbi:DEAD/DEAH box helicase [Candidatus Woesearchaeota archaeon]|nr:DEAD/DEAH box helicase [Candidatus Woesearchaeota archaeon]
MNFSELGIRQEIVNALTENNITEPTEIQGKVIPTIKAGSDVIGVSKTGSGKTIAFATPILERIEKGKGVQILVLVPVRELAEQVAKEIRKFAKYMSPCIATVYGGVSLGPQADALRRAEIVVATPGRLLDHLERRSVDLSRVKVMVLDEADKMASMGFIDDVEKIIQKTPQARQTLLFGATISDEIARLRDRYMKNPQIIKAKAHVENNLLNQFYYDVDMREKFSMLVHLLKKEAPNRAMIFCATRRIADIVARNLNLQQIRSQPIHGGMSQSARLKVLDGFHRGAPTILVATAVAARGLDIKGVSHIFNYSLSRDPEEYIHQIGRTARAGASGKAITLLSQDDHSLFSAILQRYPVKVQKLEREEFAKVAFDPGKRRFDSQARFGDNNRFGNRFSGRSSGQRRWN